VKIVFICDFFLPLGGAEKIGSELVSCLVSEGVPVTVLVGETYKNESPRGIRIISLDQKPPLLGDPWTGPFRGLFNYAAYAAVSRLVDETDTPDTVYIVNTWYHILSPSIFLALNRVAKRVVVYAHDYFLACPNGGYFDFNHQEICDRKPLSLSCLATHCDKRNYIQKLWRSGVGAMRRITWDIGRNGSKIIAVHEGMVEYLVNARIPETSVAIIRNPSQPFIKSPTKAECNREILYVGTLTAQKGFDVLTEALRERPWTVNVFGGASTNSPQIPHFRLHGFQPHEIIGRAAARSRLLIMPSRQRETFGLSALEALGSGIPVIISNQALLSRDIRAHECGLVLPTVDKANILKAVDELFNDNKKTAEFSRRGPQVHSLISPSYAQWTKQILQTCESMLQ
jgi:glycosyltransferase involved in cell wall biosynthesis